MPDFVVTALKIRSKKEESGQTSTRRPTLQGTDRDPMKHATKRDAYRAQSDFWKRKMNFRVHEATTLTTLSYELEFHEDNMQAL